MTHQPYRLPLRLPDVLLLPRPAARDLLAALRGSNQPIVK
jgi:hypothetical protein